MTKPPLSPVVSRFCLFSLCAFLLAPLCLQLQAAPSGGPYGPVSRRYELPAVKGRLYFVSPEAKAESSGASIEAPCSLESAVARVVGGDAIILRGGVYRTGGLKLNQGVLLQAYADEQPILNGSRVATEWVKQKNGLWRCAWPTLFPSKPAGWWERGSSGRKTPVHRFNLDLVFIDGRRLRSAGWEGELDADSFYINYETGQVYLSEDPTGHVIEITAHDGGLLRTMEDCHGKKTDRQGLQLRGLSFTQYAYRALEIEGHNPEGPAEPASYGKDSVGNLLEDVSITQCSRVGAYLRGDRTVVRNCLFSDTATEGLYLLSSSDCLLERNLFQRNNVDDIRGYFPAAVKIFNQCHRVVCRDNLVTDQRNSHGIWYDVGNVDGVMVDNWIEQAQYGFFFEISKGALCVGNVFVDCDSGVHSLNSCRVEVYHNTFVNAQVVFERNERSAVADHFGWHPATGPDVDQREGHVLVGNLLASQPRYREALLRVTQAPSLNARLRTTPLKTMDGNVYVRTGEGPKALIEWGPADGDKATLPLQELSDLRTLSSVFELAGAQLAPGRGSVFRAPQLKDFRLQPGLVPATPVSVPEKVQRLLGQGSLVRMPGAYQP